MPPADDDDVHLQAPRPSALTRLSALSIDEEYFAQPPPQQQPPQPATPALASPSSPSPRPGSSDLPASLAFPLSRPRSSTSPARASAPPFRAAPSVSVDDDTASIRSFVPTVSANDDLEAMLSEMLGGERWIKEDDELDMDIWEGESDEYESELSDTVPEDDGTRTDMQADC
jgi:hypothetical protein